MRLENVEDITIVPPLDTAAYASGEVMFNSCPIPKAVLKAAGKGRIIELSAVEYSDQGFGIDLYFSKAPMSLGAVQAAAAATDAGVAAGIFLGVIKIGSTDWDDIGANRVANLRNLNKWLRAASGTTSLYVSGIVRGAGTYAVNAFEATFWIEQYV